MLTDPFFWTAAGTAVGAAALCGLTGNLLLMRGWTFTGLAASQMAALGAAVFLGLGWPGETGAFVATLGTLLFLGRTRPSGGRVGDSTIAALYLVGGASTLLVLNAMPRLHSHGFDPLGGNLLYSRPSDVLNLGIAVLLAAGAAAVWFRELAATALDPDAARAHGLPVDLYHTGTLLALGIAIAMCIRLTGSLFTFAMLVLPGLTAITRLRRTGSILLGSALLAGLLALSGTALSWLQDWPTAPTIVAFATFVYGAAAILRPGHS